MTLQGKVTTYDYYTGLETLTDNLGTHKRAVCHFSMLRSRSHVWFQDRYREFARILRQWRILKNLKRGGIGSDGSRKAKEAHLGELAIECIACPKPDENLPEDWQNEDPNSR